MKRIIAHILPFLIAPLLSTGQGFTTNNTNGNLLDACGNNFIMKGINVPLAWYVNDVNGSIDNLKANTRSNCLRIVVSEGTPDASWQTTVTNCINNKIIPMVELHSVTGNTDPAALRRMGQYWAARASYFNQPNIKKHILINLANEWGTWQTATNKNTVWRDAVINAIKPMRDAGITTTIVVDAVGYGQDIDDAYNIRTYAKDIQRADNTNLGGPANSTSASNLLFSIHMYCEWKKGGDNIGIINNIKSMGIPIIVGEFGYQHASDGSCDIDEQLILNTCQTGGIGWLAWSQKGNGSPVQYLDMCVDWNCTQLSSWGNTVINGTNGTKTAVECTVFSSTSCATACTTPAPTVTSPRSYCQGATATALTANGTALKWYTASSGGTGSTTAPVPNTVAAGGFSHYVSQTLDGCEGPRANIAVNVQANPIVSIVSPANNATITANPANIAINVTVSGTGINNVQFLNGTVPLGQDPSAPYTYVWNNVANGTYVLNTKATGANNCVGAATATVTVSKLLTSLEGENEASTSPFYPNPFHHSLTIVTKEASEYTIMDMAGKEMERGKMAGTTQVGQNLPAGIYFVKLQTQQKEYVKKVIKD